MRFYLVLALLVLVQSIKAQRPELQWAGAFLANNEFNYTVNSNGRSIAVDQEGSVYSAGLFNYSTDFDPGPGVYTLKADNHFESAIYISKLSASGEFIWAIQIPTYVEFGNIEIRVDKNNNVYIASELRLATDFDPGPGVYTLTPTGGWDAFVAKYDSNGKLIWAKQFGGPGDTVPRSDVLDIDKDNNVIVCGNFNNTVDFDPGPGIYNITSSAHIQSFIVKLNNNGDFIWAKQFGNSPVIYSGSNIADVKCDPQGNIYTVGNFAGSCDFDPGPGNFILDCHSIRDGYISKLDPNGNFIWAKRIGTSTNSYYEFSDSRGIDLDANNNVYTIGDFIGTYDFDPGSNTHLVSSNASTYDWYLLKLNSQGDFIWVDVIGGHEHDIGADVAVGNDGSVYAIGTIGTEVDMDPGPGINTLKSVGQYGSSALAKFDANGAFLYAVPFDALEPTGGNSLTRRMVVDNPQNIYITGNLAGIVDFDPGAGVYALNSMGSEAPIVIKLGKCLKPTTSTLDVISCSSYMLNNESFDSSGTYVRTIANSKGCDSVITLHLTINKKTTEQTKAICSGESFYAGGANQTSSGVYRDTLRSSLNCDSIVITYLTVNSRLVPSLGPDRSICEGTTAVISPGSFNQYQWQDGSASPEFTVSAPGIYWVKVTDALECTATDSLIVQGIWPLPSNFLKDIDSICTEGTLQIGATGVFNQYLWSTGETSKQVKVLKAGAYWLKVTDTNGCVGADTISIVQKDCMSGIYFPTAFTPNNDGRNDVFKAIVYGTLESFNLQVFDREGQLVFQTTDPLKGWDGLYKSKSFSTAGFVWQCSYQLENRKPEYQKGTVLIVR